MGKTELALLVCGATLSGVAAAASDPGSSRLERRYETTLNYQLDKAKSSSHVRGFVTLDLKMIAKVWTLMGEPVVYCSASWKMKGANVEIQRRGQWHLLDTQGMPAKVWDAVELVEATIAFPVAKKGQSYRETPHAWVPCDIGATNASGDPRGSFNVPGSPSWDRFLLSRARYQTQGPWNVPSNYLPAAAAKEMLKSPDYELQAPEPGRTQDNLSMGLQMDFNFWPWISWLDEQLASTEAQRVAERAKSRKKVGDALDPFEAMVQEVETTSVQGATEADRRQARDAQQQSAGLVRQRRRALASKGCGSDLEPLADLDAAASRAEAGHEKCGNGTGVVAFRDKDSSLFGFKRPDGSVLITPRFDKAENFSEGLALVRGAECGDTYCFVNAAGTVAIKTQSRSAKSFANGLAPVLDPATSKFGYIDREGKYAIAPRYSHAEPFKDGRAKVSILLRRQPGADACKTSWTFYSVGEIAITGQYVSGPNEEGVSFAPLCLTRS